MLWSVQFSSVQLLSRVRLFATPWTAARQASLSITNSRSSLKLMSIESVMPSSHLILCHPLLLPPSVFPSIRVFSNESVLASGGKSIGVSASALDRPMNIQDWFPLGGTGLISKITFSIVGLFNSWFKQIPKMTFDYCLLSLFQSRQSTLSLPQHPPHQTMFCKETRSGIPKNECPPCWICLLPSLWCHAVHHTVHCDYCEGIRFFPSSTFSARILLRLFVYITQQHLRKFTMSGYFSSGVQMYITRIIFWKSFITENLQE